MAGKRKLESDDAKQSKRFIEAARKIKADESGKKFEQAFKKIAPRKKTHRR
jgi:hypothetical protein